MQGRGRVVCPRCEEVAHSFYSSREKEQQTKCFNCGYYAVTEIENDSKNNHQGDGKVVKEIAQKGAFIIKYKNGNETYGYIDEDTTEEDVMDWIGQEDVDERYSYIGLWSEENGIIEVIHGSIPYPKKLYEEWFRDSLLIDVVRE